MTRESILEEIENFIHISTKDNASDKYIGIPILLLAKAIILLAENVKNNR